MPSLLKNKVISKRDDLDLVTRTKSGDGSMVPLKKARYVEERGSHVAMKIK